MSFEVSSSFPVRRIPTLVFGERGIAHLIAKQLHDYGFDPLLMAEWTSDPLPVGRTPESLEQMRKLLSRFAELSRGRGVIHPGATPWAERPELPSLAQEIGINVISPPVRSLSFFENKLNFLLEADRMGIPHLVKSFDPIYSAREIEALIIKTGQPLPLLLKTALGSSSLARLYIQEERELKTLLPTWLVQVRKNFGEVLLFMEKCIEGARHIIVPFARFSDQRTYVFPTIDASLQSHYRKILEFAPAHPDMDPEVHYRLVGWTNQILERCNFVGVGALEFLVEDTQAYLIDCVARLNTSFRLWEQVCGTKAVAWQLSTLGFLPRKEYPPIQPQRSWSMGLSLRITAEDSFVHLPHPGLIQETSQPPNLSLGITESAEVILNYREGETLPITSSGVVGYIFLSSKTRERVFEIAKKCLNQIWVAGNLQTNESFLSQLVFHPWVREGMYHAGFVDEDFVPYSDFPSEFMPFLKGICQNLQDRYYGKNSETVPAWMIGDNKVLLELSLGETIQKLQWIEGPRYWEVFDSWGLSGTLKISANHFLRVCAMPLSLLQKDKWLIRFGHHFILARAIDSKKIKETKIKEINFKDTPVQRIKSIVSGKVHGIFFRVGSVAPAHEPLALIECYGRMIPYSLPKKVLILEWKVASGAIVEHGQTIGIVQDHLS